MKNFFEGHTIAVGARRNDDDGSWQVRVLFANFDTEKEAEDFAKFYAEWFSEMIGADMMKIQ